MSLTLLQTHESLLVFILAVALSRLLPLHSWYHPNAFYSHLFAMIGKRVYQPNTNKQQWYIAGSLAFLLPIATIVVLIFGISSFALYPVWVDGLLLYLCLYNPIFERKAQKIAKLLDLGQKATARQLSTQLVVRDTRNLSEVGIIKACIESLCLNQVRQFWVIVLLYLGTGPWLMLAYKLMLLCNHAWRKTLPPNSYFMKPLERTLFVVEWPFIRMFVALLSLLQNYKKTWHYIRLYGRHCYQTNSGWILSLFAASLNVQLGGPALYQGERFQKMRFGTERHPLSADIRETIRLLNYLRWFLLALICLLWAALNLFLQTQLRN
ncbi:cobalamin biosynthesis protein [Pseudoalteromonas fenneropenaei]|uniref:Cobalamin biosynthesis protein n=1 Tax=Pseudoalteromonas fenneropenaei TaxID=1737459 RepID=A0ABV7CEW6_9GAMM